MWKKKKPENPKIKVHKLEIEKLKLQGELDKQKTAGIVSACLLLLMLLVILLFFI